MSNSSPRVSRISTNNPVRRRLFPSPTDADEESRLDNLANFTQESLQSDKMEKITRWNFDFENELPLPGNYEWVRTGFTEDYIGRHVCALLDDDGRCHGLEREDCIMVSTNNKSETGDDEEIPMEGRKALNETTPDKDNESVIDAKRCKLSDGTTTRKSVKRNIMFQ